VHKSKISIDYSKYAFYDLAVTIQYVLGFRKDEQCPQLFFAELV
jgi:hypothetical protein